MDVLHAHLSLPLRFVIYPGVSVYGCVGCPSFTLAAAAAVWFVCAIATAVWVWRQLLQLAQASRLYDFVIHFVFCLLHQHVFSTCSPQHLVSAKLCEPACRPCFAVIWKRVCIFIFRWRASECFLFHPMQDVSEEKIEWSLLVFSEYCCKTVCTSRM